MKSPSQRLKELKQEQRENAKKAIIEDGNTYSPRAQAIMGLSIEYNSHQGQREMARRRKRLAKQLDKHFGIE